MTGISRLERASHIPDDHVANPVQPISLMQQVLAKDCGGNLRQMLVLRDGGDFDLRQATERDAILKRDHVVMESRSMTRVTPGTDQAARSTASRSSQS